MEKEPLITRLIKHFYGLTGPFDEFHEQVVNRIGNRVFVGYWYLTTLGIAFGLLGSLFKDFWPDWGLTALLTLFIICHILVIPMIILNKVANTDIGNQDIEVPLKDLAKIRKKEKRRAWLLGSLTGIAPALIGIIQNLAEGQSLSESLNPGKIIFTLLAILFCGGIFAGMAGNNIEAEKDDD